MYSIRAYLDPVLDLYHGASIFVGLLELAHKERIKLELVYPWMSKDNKLAGDAATVRLEAKELSSNRTRLICIDLRDRSDYLHNEQLEISDVYFKRSYYQPDLLQLPDHLKRKVLPFGLNYSCRSQRILIPLLRAFFNKFAWCAIGPTHLHRVEGLLKAWRMLETCLVAPQKTYFERSPESALEPAIVFQTRIWAPEETGQDSSRELNGGRIAVVRALKEAFGNRFLGGLVPTDYARTECSDLLTIRKTYQRSYISMSRQCLIGVYTRGIHHSIAFKMAEYLASSKCIVSEHLKHDLPTLLIEGKNYLLFSSPEECVEACWKLLKDRNLAMQMRQYNHEYYLKEVEPASHMLQCLERALQKPC